MPTQPCERRKNINIITEGTNIPGRTREHLSADKAKSAVMNISRVKINSSTEEHGGRRGVDPLPISPVQKKLSEAYGR